MTITAFGNTSSAAVLSIKLKHKYLKACLFINIFVKKNAAGSWDKKFVLEIYFLIILNLFFRTLSGDQTVTRRTHR